MIARRTALIAVLLTCALAVVNVSLAAASGPEHWYKNNVQFPEGEARAVSGESAGTTTIKAPEGVGGFGINCVKSSMSGSVVNPTGGGPGTIETNPWVMSWCTVEQTAQHCSVKQASGPIGTIAWVGMKGTAQPEHAVSFEAKSGGILVQFELTGCAFAGWNRKWEIGGAMVGRVNSQHEVAFVLSKVNWGGTYGSIVSSTPLKSEGVGVELKEAEKKVESEPEPEPKETGPDHWYNKGVKLGAGKVKPLSVTGQDTLLFEWTVATVPLKLSCRNGAVSGSSVENPLGGGPGVLGEGQLVLRECVMLPAAQHCVVSGLTPGDPAGTITFPYVHGAAETGHGISLTTSGESSAKYFELSGCATVGLNKQYGVAGSASGYESPLGSGKFMFYGASKLKLGGIAVSLNAWFALESESSPVEVKE